LSQPDTFRIGNETLFIDGTAVGTGRVEASAPIIFSADETSDVGLKRGSPMLPEMPSAKSGFNGKVQVVAIEAPGESVDHLLDREQVLNMILARQ
jgi:arylsulfatase